MTVQWLDDNTLVQASLGSMTPDVWADVGSFPWVSLDGASSPSARNLELRVTIAGEPGACATPKIVTSGLRKGAWVLTLVSPACGTSGASQLQLTCPSCQLTEETSLTLTFPYSCQSMLLEAGGVPPYPRAPLARAALHAPPALTVGKPGALLSSLTWTLTPVLSVLWDNITDKGALGWRLLNQKLVLGASLAATPQGGGAVAALALQPASAAVTLTIALPLSSTYAATLLTPLVPWTQLLANIVGLSGVVGVFGMAFGFWESLFGGPPAPTKLTSTQREEKAAGDAAAQIIFAVTNPMHTPPAPPSNTEKQPTTNGEHLPPGWRVVADGAEYWYVDGKGEAHWDLPAHFQPKENIPPGWVVEGNSEESWYIDSHGEPHWDLPTKA